MGGILVYQGAGQAEPALSGLFKRLVFVSDPEQVTDRLERGCYQMVLIHMDKGEAGLRAASLVRKVPGYRLTPILVLADDRSHEQRAFHECHCYDYLVKPIGRDEIVRILYPLLLRLYDGRNERWMRVRVCGETREIPVGDILYMESVNRSVCIHMMGETLEIPYLPLKQCREEYEGVFVQCHRCVLVNRDFVIRIDYRKKRVELPGCCVDIGRRFESVLHREFD